MLIGVPREILQQEKRVAATPETVRRYISRKHNVIIESGAGKLANFTDDSYEKAGATIGSAQEALSCDIVLKVRTPTESELNTMKNGATLVGIIDLSDHVGFDKYIKNAGITAFSLESVPRITRAQSLDVQSSQANLAGYKAVLLGASYYNRLIPTMMTAAGTMKAARIVVLGVGVAGLQAIATARRLGAIVEACDVRPSVKEQVESLGAKFISVPFENEIEREIAKGTGGYARPMPESWLIRQANLISEKCRKADLIITTALIPGHAAPILISEDVVKSMRAGSVIVDLAIDKGGNCSISEFNKIVTKYDVTLIGLSNLPALVAGDSSLMYSNNLENFLKLIINDEGILSIQYNDEIIRKCLVCPNNDSLNG